MLGTESDQNQIAFNKLRMEGRRRGERRRRGVDKGGVRRTDEVEGDDERGVKAKNLKEMKKRDYRAGATEQNTFQNKHGFERCDWLGSYYAIASCLQEMLS